MAADLPRVPAKYIIRGYLRKQDSDQRQFRERLRHEFLQEWKSAYGAGKLSDNSLEHLSTEFEAGLRASGAFSVHRNVSPPSRAAPYRHRHSVSGFIGAPMTLARDWSDETGITSREP